MLKGITHNLCGVIGVISASLLATFVIAASANALFTVPHPNQMLYLGAADGKAFFLENSRQNWTSAKSNCEAFNMTLASIQTNSQTKFVVNALRLLENTNWTWTAGREYLSHSAFVWDDTGRELSPDALESWHTAAYQLFYCVHLKVHNVTFHYFLASRCDYQGPSLCAVDTLN